jgi:phosphoribosylanthranilate isomerase
MFVKICGITREEDAQAAVELGASAIGFIFWPGSPRFIDPFRARRIAVRLPPVVTVVGVFVNQQAAEVNGVANVVPLAAIQLHGDETPSFAATLRRPVLKAVSRLDLVALSAWPAHVTLLVDVDDPVKRGGTGKVPDWGAAAALARSRPVILAGGLRPDNVVDAIEAVRPFGIDVSSGVESRPGIKDRAKLEALFGAIARAGAKETVR